MTLPPHRGRAAHGLCADIRPTQRPAALRRAVSRALQLTVLLWLAALAAPAQTAEAFFNSGAQFYISNNIPAALDKVETGLKQHPTDEKLKKLEELLKHQQQQNQSPTPKNQQNQGEKEQAQASRAREMSPQEAKQLLDAQKGDERFLPLNPQKPPENRNLPIKDW